MIALVPALRSATRIIWMAILFTGIARACDRGEPQFLFHITDGDYRCRCFSGSIDSVVATMSSVPRPLYVKQETIPGCSETKWASAFREAYAWWQTVHAVGCPVHTPQRDIIETTQDPRNEDFGICIDDHANPECDPLTMAITYHSYQTHRYGSRVVGTLRRTHTYINDHDFCYQSGGGSCGDCAELDCVSPNIRVGIGLVARHEYGHHLGLCHPTGDNLCNSIMDRSSEAEDGRLCDYTEACPEAGESDIASIELLYARAKPSPVLDVEVVQGRSAGTEIRVQCQSAEGFPFELLIEARDGHPDQGSRRVGMLPPHSIASSGTLVIPDPLGSSETEYLVRSKISGRYIPVVAGRLRANPRLLE